MFIQSISGGSFLEFAACLPAGRPKFQVAVDKLLNNRSRSYDGNESKNYS